jgi:hypothetical protein
VPSPLPRGVRCLRHMRSAFSRVSGHNLDFHRVNGINPKNLRPVTPSAALSEVIGAKAVARTEVTKKLWAYIKKHGLQDKKNKRMIHADDALRPVFGKPLVNMFEMTKLVSDLPGSAQGVSSWTIPSQWIESRAAKKRTTWLARPGGNFIARVASMPGTFQSTSEWYLTRIGMLVRQDSSPVEPVELEGS